MRSASAYTRQRDGTPRQAWIQGVQRPGQPAQTGAPRRDAARSRRLRAAVTGALACSFVGAPVGGQLGAAVRWRREITVHTTATSPPTPSAIACEVESGPTKYRSGSPRNTSKKNRSPA